MSTVLMGHKTQLSVRIDDGVITLLDAHIARSRQAGHRVTKEKLVEDAIRKAYPDPLTHGANWLPTIDGKIVTHWDPRSNTGLLDMLDEFETNRGDAA